MNNDLTALEQWVGGLLAKLQPGQRRIVNRKVALDLRRNQAARIASQTNPDGTPFEPRKNRKNLSGKSGRIKRQRAQMFNKLRTAMYLKADSNEHQIGVGFMSKVGRIARVHHDGLPDKVDRNGPVYKYPSRKLLGITEADRVLIRESVLRHLNT